MRRPSQRSIDLYNQLVKRQNEVRKALRKIHKHAEETLGAGRLPALVIPKSAKRIRRNYFEGISKAELTRRLRMFWNSYKQARELFSGKDPLRKYLGRTVFDGYRQLWVDLIGTDPEGSTGHYTQEQIINAGDAGQFMEVFNKLFSRGQEMYFLALLYTKQVIEFKWIYQEYITGGVNYEYGYLSQQRDILARYINNPKARKELYERASEITGYNHQNKTISKAEKRKERYERKEED